MKYKYRPKLTTNNPEVAKDLAMIREENEKKSLAGREKWVVLIQKEKSPITFTTKEHALIFAKSYDIVDYELRNYITREKIDI